MHEPTPDLVRRFHAFLLGLIGARSFDKRIAPEMRVLALVLGHLRGGDRALFLEQQPTTICRRIYLPFEPGVPSSTWPLWKQMVALVREGQKVLRNRQQGCLWSGWRWLTREQERIQREIESFLCHLEMHLWRYRELPSLKDLTRTLQKYEGRPFLTEFCEAMLQVAGESVKQGAVISDAGRIALPWLTRNADSLRAKAGV
jgi:hypothetical protein